MSGRLSRKKDCDGRTCDKCAHASPVTDRWLDLNGNPTLCSCPFSKWLMRMWVECENGKWERKNL